MRSIKNSPSPKKAIGRQPYGAGAGWVILAGVLLVGVLVGVAALALMLSSGPGTGQAAAELTGKTSSETAIARREQARNRLNSYGWLDQEAGRVSIPIDRAMAEIAATGLPVGTEGLETPTPTPAPPTETPPPAPNSTGEPAAGATPPPESEPTEPPPPTVDLANVSFQNDVLPIFQEHCSECHSGEAPKEGLVLMSYEDIMAGSWNGSVIEPGDVDSSYLIEQVVTGRMPKRGPHLSDDQIAIIKAWVAAGAPDN